VGSADTTSANRIVNRNIRLIKYQVQHLLPSTTTDISATTGIQVDGGTVGGGKKTVPRRAGVSKSDDRRKHQRRFVKDFISADTADYCQHRRRPTISFYLGDSSLFADTATYRHHRGRSTTSALPRRLFIRTADLRQTSSSSLFHFLIIKTFRQRLHSPPIQQISINIYKDLLHHLFRNDSPNYC